MRVYFLARKPLHYARYTGRKWSSQPMSKSEVSGTQ